MKIVSTLDKEQVVRVWVFWIGSSSPFLAIWLGLWRHTPCSMKTNFFSLISLSLIPRYSTLITFNIIFPHCFPILVISCCVRLDHNMYKTHHIPTWAQAPSHLYSGTSPILSLFREQQQQTCQFCLIGKDCDWNGHRLSKNDEKLPYLPYLHKLYKRKFLVIDKNMELCLYMATRERKKDIRRKREREWRKLQHNQGSGKRQESQSLGLKFLIFCKTFFSEKGGGVLGWGMLGDLIIILNHSFLKFFAFLKKVFFVLYLSLTLFF